MIFALLLDLSGTTITLQPTTQPGAIAEIVMDSRNTNGPQDEVGTFLDLGDLHVGIHFDWNHDGSQDAIKVSPPDGVICEPATCVLSLEEDTVGVLYLYGWEGM